MFFRLGLLLLGLLAGFGLSLLLPSRGPGSPASAANTVSLMLAGLLTAFLLSARAASLASRGADVFGRWFGRLEPRRVTAATVGLIVALLLSVLLSSLLSEAPFYTWYWNAVITLALAAFFVRFATQHANVFDGLAPTGAPRRRAGAKILDTNVIIDGRVLELARAGFLEGELLVPGFVLRELQFQADHADPQRRARGKRGLGVLEDLRGLANLSVHDWDSPDIAAVDDKLVRLARDLGAKLVTNDANLSKVAGLYGVPVLSIHAAALALRPKLTAGESLDLTVTKGGQQPGQGVGYLDDGTMIVVEDGLKYKGKTVRVQVLSNVQTSVGRMVFARVDGE